MGFLKKIFGGGRVRRRDIGRAWAPYQEELNRFRSMLAPYGEAGQYGLNELLAMLRTGPGEFVESPGYQFRLGEGIKARERGAAARGMQLSGAQQKALARYGQEYATGEYENFLRRYYQKMAPFAGLAEMGRGVQSELGQAGLQRGLGLAGGLTGAAQSRAQQQTRFANTLLELGGTLFGSFLGGGGSKDEDALNMLLMSQGVPPGLTSGPPQQLRTSPFGRRMSPFGG